MRFLIVFLVITLCNNIGKTQDKSFYIGCATHLEFDPKIFNKLSINVLGADTVIIPPTTLIIIPYDSVVDINVTHKGSNIMILQSDALYPPLPALEVRADQVNITNSEIFPLKTKRLDLVARPNADFATIKPMECRYRVIDSEIIVKRKGRVICKNKFGEVCPLEVNDDLTINFYAIERTNFRNEKILIEVRKSINYIVR